MQKDKVFSEYGELIHSPESVDLVTDSLMKSGSVLIGWTDEKFSHYDILLNYVVDFYPQNRSALQGGISPNDLFVSIMRLGSFGFEVCNNCSLSQNYLAEKLGLDSLEFSKFLNDIIQSIYEKEQGDAR